MQEMAKIEHMSYNVEYQINSHFLWEKKKGQDGGPGGLPQQSL